MVKYGEEEENGNKYCIILINLLLFLVVMDFLEEDFWYNYF